MRGLHIAAIATLVACAAPSETTREQPLSAEEKRLRATLIRDSAAEMGVYNAALLGGIAVSETGLAHCWSEATFTCKGPDSPSCNGPVLAGAADGACSLMQGGLGMFQFDAGTHAQTVATYGPSILTVEGNTAQAVNFVVDRLMLDITGVDDWMSAVGYLNRVPLMAGDPITEEWADFLACRYNGCCSTSSLCTQRANDYRDNAIDLYIELGAEFWTTATRCAGLPESGFIDQRSECYLAGGDPRYWRRETTGIGDSSEWTNTTSNTAPANFARWLIRPGYATRLQIDIHVIGGAATKAVYDVVHAGQTDRISVDQTQVSGFFALGEFDFTGDGTEYVQLGDNAGATGQKLVFDALRVVDLDGGPPDDEETAAGCGCQSGGGAAGSGGLLALIAVLVLRRRRA